MSLSEGKKAEEEFASLFSEVLFSTTEEDIFGHYDVTVPIRIDIKKVKKIRRSDAYPDENYHWVELRNVHGDHGWLYGKAHGFAFQTDDYWVLVHASALRGWVRRNIDPNDLTPKPEVNMIYTREGRKDKMVLVKTIDLMAIGKIIKRQHR